jgi:hypothetical protein
MTCIEFPDRKRKLRARRFIGPVGVCRHQAGNEAEIAVLGNFPDCSQPDAWFVVVQRPGTDLNDLASANADEAIKCRQAHARVGMLDLFAKQWNPGRPDSDGKHLCIRITRQYCALKLPFLGFGQSVVLRNFAFHIQISSLSELLVMCGFLGE